MDSREIIWDLIRIIGAILGVIISLKGLMMGIQEIWNLIHPTQVFRYGFSYSSYTNPNPFGEFIGGIIWFGGCFILFAVSASFLGEKIYYALYAIFEKLK